MINVSVIIPHYGSMELLERCVASVPQREDVETIVIIDEDGKGAGWARNRGLEKAKGKYVIFADSDDFFHPCFNEFLDGLKTETVDMVFFNADSIELETGKPSWRANHLNRIICSKNKEWQDRHLRYYFTEPWCRAIRMSLIEEYAMRFSETQKNNDIFFTAQAGYYAKTVKLNEGKYYCIGNCQDSIGKSTSKEKKIQVACEIARTNAFLRGKGVNHIHNRMMRPFVAALLMCDILLARDCWNEMKATGLPTSFLLYCFFRYPFDLAKLVLRKIQSREI